MAGKFPFATSLEMKARQLGLTPDEFRDWLKSRGYTQQDIEEIFSPHTLGALVERCLEGLVPTAAKMLGWSPRQLTDSISVEVRNADNVECHVEIRGSTQRRHTLRVYAGFLFFAHKVIYALANGLLQAESPSIPGAEEEAAILLNAFYGRKPLERAWAIRPYSLDQRQRYLIAFLFGYIREAAVAHELGHIVYCIGRDRCAPVRELERHLSTLANPNWGEGWVEEFAADFLAVTFLGQPKSAEFASCHGLIVLLFIIEMLEMCAQESQRPARTHPPAAARRALLVITRPWLLNPALANVDATCQKIVRLAQS